MPSLLSQNQFQQLALRKKDGVSSPCIHGISLALGCVAAITIFVLGILAKSRPPRNAIPRRVKSKPNSSSVASRPVKPQPERRVSLVLHESNTQSEKPATTHPQFPETNLLNLNQATVEQLQRLPGIGPSMAGKILVAREEKGGFKSVDELGKVPGIGEKTMSRLRPLVTVS